MHQLLCGVVILGMAGWRGRHGCSAGWLQLAEQRGMRVARKLEGLLLRLLQLLRLPGQLLLPGAVLHRAAVVAGGSPLQHQLQLEVLQLLLAVHLVLHAQLGRVAAPP
jgi:hypothetical protein